MAQMQKDGITKTVPASHVDFFKRLGYSVTETPPAVKPVEKSPVEKPAMLDEVADDNLAGEVKRKKAVKHG
jgi:hypothetical protein